MQLKFEHFAATSMLGAEDSPPRHNGKMWFNEWWERHAFGIAIALSKKGHYDWEDFRQRLIASIGEWEQSHESDDPSWSYYERFLIALERLMVDAGVLESDELERRVTDLRQPDACKSQARQCSAVDATPTMTD